MQTQRYPDIASASRHRTVRFFISSTFVDFQQEREVLVKRIFPQLRARFRSHGVELVDIDLRWGILDDEVERGQALPICLQEIDRCRPYFIGLLGSRYGSLISQQTLAPDLVRRFPVLADASGRSITEIEFRHAVLSRAEPNAKACFFLRRGDPAQHSPDQDNLTRLRHEVSDTNLAIAKSYTTIDEFEKAAFTWLCGLLETDVLQNASTERSPTLAHEDFASEKLRDYIAHGSILSTLDGWQASGSSHSAVIQGAAGSGKSSTLANWVAARRAVDPALYTFEHYVGAEQNSSDLAALVFRLAWFITGITGTGDDHLAASDELITTIPRMLQSASMYAEANGCRWLLVIDGVDQLSRRDCHWLPDVMPPHVALLVSTQDENIASQLADKGWPAFTVTPLDNEAAQRLIDQRLRKFGKGLPSHQRQRILTHPCSNNPLFLKTLVDELRVFGQHQALSSLLDWYLDAANLQELFAKLLVRHEQDFGTPLTRSATTLLWASRAGLEDSEIGKLLSQPLSDWQSLQSSLADNLVNRQGRWLPATTTFRDAIETRYLTHPDAEGEVRRTLAEHFSRSESLDRRAEEWPWQLCECGAWNELAAALTDIDGFRALLAGGTDQLRQYWVRCLNNGIDIVDRFAARWDEYDADIEQTLRQQNTAYFNPKILVLPELLDFLSRSGFHGIFAARLAAEMAEALRWADGIDGPWRTWLATSLEVLRLTGKGEQIRSILSHLNDRYGETWLADDEGSYRILGTIQQVYAEDGRLNEAISIAERLAPLKQKMFGEHSESALIQLNNLAALYRQAGRVEESQTLYREVYQLRLALLGPDNEDTLVSQYNLASVMMRTGELDEALTVLIKNFEAKRRVFGVAHISTWTSMHGLAECYRLKGDNARAFELLSNLILAIQVARCTHHTIYVYAVLGLAQLASADSPRLGLQCITAALRQMSTTEAPQQDALELLVFEGDALAKRVGREPLVEVFYENLCQLFVAWGKQGQSLHCFVVGRQASLHYDRGEFEQAAVGYKFATNGLLDFSGTLEGSVIPLDKVLKNVDTFAGFYLETLRRLGQSDVACREGRHIAHRLELAKKDSAKPKQTTDQLLLAIQMEVERSRSLANSGDLASAEQTLLSCLETVEEAIGEGEDAALSVRSSLGAFYGRAGRHAEALDVFSRGLVLARSKSEGSSNFVELFSDNCRLARERLGTIH